MSPQNVKCQKASGFLTISRGKEIAHSDQMGQALIIQVMYCQHCKLSRDYHYSFSSLALFFYCSCFFFLVLIEANLLSLSNNIEQIACGDSALLYGLHIHTILILSKSF